MSKDVLFHWNMVKQQHITWLSVTVNPISSCLRRWAADPCTTWRSSPLDLCRLLLLLLLLLAFTDESHKRGVRRKSWRWRFPELALKLEQLGVNKKGVVLLVGLTLLRCWMKRCLFKRKSFIPRLRHFFRSEDSVHPECLLSSFWFAAKTLSSGSRKENVLTSS